MKHIWGQQVDRAEVQARIHLLERQTEAIILELAGLRSSLNDLCVDLERDHPQGRLVDDPCVPGL